MNVYSKAQTIIIGSLSSVITVALLYLTGWIEPREKPMNVHVLETGGKEYGPDGYGSRHLCKEDFELVTKCLMQMEGNPWSRPILFGDMTVISAETKKPMEIAQITSLLHDSPKVATVSYIIGAKRSFFSLETLAYPQYEHEYRLTREQWESLQNYCRIQLIDPIASDPVVEHWRSIVSGKVPFGLQIQN